MRKFFRITQIIVIALVVCFITAFFLSLSVTFPGKRNRMLDYYSDDENYCNIVCKIVEIENSPDKNIIFIIVEYVDEQGELQTKQGFRILNTSFNRISQNGYSLEVGQEYVITTARGIFWSGYTSPIVAIQSKDRMITLLDFDEGRADFLYYVKYVMH